METNSFYLGDIRPLPSSVTVDGKSYDIRTGARGMLRILRALQDENVSHMHRIGMLCKWFYVEQAPDSPVQPFLSFLRMGEEAAQENEENVEDEEEAPDFDFEFDAVEIVASFQQLYGLDLLGEDGNMHWWRFRVLLNGCFGVDCPLSAKVSLRKADPDKADANTRRAIEKAQIPTRESAEERRKCKEMTQRLLQHTSKS